MVGAKAGSSRFTRTASVLSTMFCLAMLVTACGALGATVTVTGQRNGIRVTGTVENPVYVNRANLFTVTVDLTAVPGFSSLLREYGGWPVTVVAKAYHSWPFGSRCFGTWTSRVKISDGKVRFTGYASVPSLVSYVFKTRTVWYEVTVTPVQVIPGILKTTITTNQATVDVRR